MVVLLKVSIGIFRAFFLIICFGLAPSRSIHSPLHSSRRPGGILRVAMVLIGARRGPGSIDFSLSFSAVRFITL